MTQNDSPSSETVAENKKRTRYVGVYARIAAFTAFLFGLFRTSLVGRFFTAYSKAENSIIGDTGYEKPGSLTGRARRRLAGRLENNVVLNKLKAAGRFFAWSPLNMYGIFFLFYGLVSGSITLLSGFSDDSVRVGEFILSVMITVCSIPLVCISSSIMEILPVSRLAKWVAGNVMAFPEKKRIHRTERKNMVVQMYCGIFTGIIFGALSLYFDVIIIPLVFAAAVMVATVLTYPETGVVLLVGFLPFIMLFDPQGIILSVLVLTIWLSYFFKLLLGRRTIKTGLLDWVVILFMVNILLCGIASPGGMSSFIDALRLAVLMSAYFPAANLIKSTEWAQRCAKMLVFNSSVIAYAYVIMFFLGEKISQWCADVNAGILQSTVVRITAAFESDTLMPCFFIIMTPLVIMSLCGLKRLVPMLASGLTMTVFAVCIFLTMDGWAWIAALIGIIIMPVLYSPESLSATFVTLFPVTCAGFWLPRLNEKYLHLESFAPIEAAGDAIVNAFSHINLQINKNVIKMIKGNPFGIGIGRSAFEAVYPLYAEAGTELASYVSSFYLGVTAHTGIIGLVLILLTVILFLQKCFEFFKRADNRLAGAKVLALLAGFAALLIYGIDNWIWADPAMFFMFWVVIALASAYINCGYEDDQRNCAEHGVTKLSSDITIFR